MLATRAQAAVLLWILVAGCFGPRYQEGVVCSETGTCPPGMSCNPVDNRCWLRIDPGVCGDGVVNAAAGEVCEPGRDSCCAATCDALMPAGSECRPSAGPCDPAEHCTGSAATCPPDERAAAATECRPGNGTCDPAEVCDGVNPACPGDATLPDGSACGACTSTVCDTCMAGRCSDTCGDGTVDTGAGEQCEPGDDAACPGHCDGACRCAYPRSCQEYLAATPGLPSGFYTLEPDAAGSGDPPFEAYCDMTTDGGGWTLIMRASGDNFAYDAPQWTSPALLDENDYAFDAPGLAKYASFNTVPFRTIRTSDVNDFGVNHQYTFAAAQDSALALFSGPGFEIGTTLVDYFNERVPATSRQWGCTTYTNYGFNQRDYLGVAFLPDGPLCDWNGGARWGQRINANHGDTGNHAGQGWGPYGTIDAPPYTLPTGGWALYQLLWVR